MSQQNQQTFTMRIVRDDTTHTGGGTASCRATVDGGGTAGPTVDLMAAYRTSRAAAQSSLSSMRFTNGFRSGGGTAFYRRAA